LNIFDGSSTKRNAQAAVLEASKHWDDDFLPDILFVFHSTRQNPHDIALILDKRFSKTLIVGCTTAGEWLAKQHKNNELVLLGITSPDIKWSMSVLENLSSDPADGAKAVCTELLQQLGINWMDLNSKEHFCLSFFDGLSKREEPIIAAMASELGNIPLLGGSAGDDLKFESTYVIANAKAYQNAAVFVLAESKLPFKAVKYQHFIPGDVDTIITKADVSKRIVYHLDGMPAAERYAQLLHRSVEDLNTQIFSEHPLIYQYQQECYVRSISQLGENNSLIFYCAIEEGMILNLCSHQNMVQQFNNALQKLSEPSNNIELILIFNCILRQLESKSTDCLQGMASEVGVMSKHVIGFDTYGEQWQGLHINQTMVALAMFNHG